MMSSVDVASFAMLVVAMLALWAPRLSAAPRAASWWVLPFAAALMLAVAGGLVDVRGLATVVVMAAACRLVHHAPSRTLRGIALVVVLASHRGTPCSPDPRLCQPTRPRRGAAERRLAAVARDTWTSTKEWRGCSCSGWWRRSARRVARVRRFRLFSRGSRSSPQWCWPQPWLPASRAGIPSCRLGGCCGRGPWCS